MKTLSIHTKEEELYTGDWRPQMGPWILAVCWAVNRRWIISSRISVEDCNAARYLILIITRTSISGHSEMVAEGLPLDWSPSSTRVTLYPSPADRSLLWASVRGKARFMHLEKVSKASDFLMVCLNLLKDHVLTSTSSLGTPSVLEWQRWNSSMRVSVAAPRITKYAAIFQNNLPPHFQEAILYHRKLFLFSISSV